MPKISIIVPVYKAEKYLNRCVDSILAQTFTDWELLLVDDGSPDNSGVICDEYSRNDNRIRVFHKENGGVSSARQRGMDEAKGEYTIHVDPDDWVEPTMLEELYQKAIEENADMVIFDYISEDRSGGRVCKQEPKECSAEAILKQLLFQQLHGSCWNKFVRRTCYTKYNVKFPLDIICWEDMYVNCSLLIHPLKCAYLPKAFYHYDMVVNSNSIVRKPTRKVLDSQINFIKHFQSLGISNEWLYLSKRSTKELAYRSGFLDKKQVISLFSEINGTYIKEETETLNLIHNGLSALISGNYLKYKIYRILYFVRVLGARLKTRLRFYTLP